eukprot:751898-Hanusia_phi.AAC.2
MLVLDRLGGVLSFNSQGEEEEGTGGREKRGEGRLEGKEDVGWGQRNGELEWGQESSEGGGEEAGGACAKRAVGDKHAEAEAGGEEDRE